MEIVELKALEGKYLSSVESNIMNPVTEWLNPKLIFVDENRMECEFVVRPEMADPLGIFMAASGRQCYVTFLGY